MCHPYVAGDEASRPVITEVLIYLYELEKMTKGDEEIPTPKFAFHRVHDILFVIGGLNSCLGTADFFDCYSTHADRWTKVSCTQLHSYSALLSNCKCH
jgi:kelch-like protein 10